MWEIPEPGWLVQYQEGYTSNVRRVGHVLSVAQGFSPAVRILWKDGGGETVMFRDYTSWSHGVWTESKGSLWVFEAPPLICNCTHE